MGNTYSKAGVVPMCHPSKQDRRRSFQHDPASNGVTKKQREILMHFHGVEDDKRLDESRGEIPLGDSFQSTRASWKASDPATCGMRGSKREMDGLVKRTLEELEEYSDYLHNGKIVVVQQRKRNSACSNGSQ